MNVIFRFKMYKNIVLNDQKELFQLSYFKGKYTHPFKKLVYNDERKAYRIHSQWVTTKRLNKLSYKVNETISTENETNLEIILYQIQNQLTQTSKRLPLAI